jgi:hypothetical protein
MLYLCKGNARKRFQLECTRFYSSTELFQLARKINRSIPIYFEYGPNLYQPINNDTELRFVCLLLEGNIESYMSSDDIELHRLDMLDIAHTTEFERGRKPLRIKHKKDCESTMVDVTDGVIVLSK